MSKVVKANQITVSGSWHSELIAEHCSSVIEQTGLRQVAISQLQAAQDVASAMLTSARVDAASLLHKAEAELAHQRELGYQAGYDEGVAAGYEAGKVQGAATWRAKLEELEQERRRLLDKDRALLQEAEQELQVIALAVIERVLNYKLRQDDMVLQTALEQVLALAKGSREALLLVSPDNFDSIWQERTRWANLLPGVKEFDVQADGYLSRGDLVLETNQGTIDARVDTVLEQVAALLNAEGQE